MVRKGDSTSMESQASNDERHREAEARNILQLIGTCVAQAENLGRPADEVLDSISRLIARRPPIKTYQKPLG